MELDSSFVLPPPVTAYFPDDMSKFVFGAPGELTVDASYGKAAFPVPDKTLVFPSEGDYLQFMVQTFNAKIEWDETGRPFPVIQTTTLGIPYVVDQNGKLVEVESPIATFLGGPDGYYVVDGKTVCVDLDNCQVECITPASSSTIVIQMPQETSLSRPLDDSAASVSSMASMESTPQSLFGPFEITGKASVRFVNHLYAPNPNAFVSVKASTDQTSGAPPYEIAICGPPTIKTLKSGLMVMVPGVCSTHMLNRTHLNVVLQVYPVHNWDFCGWGGYYTYTASADDVTRVSVEVAYQILMPTQVSGIKTFNNGSEHSGRSSADERCHGTGCFVSNPCW